MENQNSVCYVGVIGEVKPIEGADNIELVVVNGWNAITKKGEHKEGDLVVVATTDAIIPQQLSDNMGVTNYLRKGKYVKGKGVKDIPGTDLMETLGIFKYEPPVKMMALSNGKKVRYHQNPNFHIYYKFPNMKNVPDMFTEEDEVVISRKFHGTNARYGIVRKKKLSLWDKVRKFFGNEWVDFEYVYGSHNVEKGSDSQGFYDTDVWREVADDYQIRKKLWTHVKDTYYPEELTKGFIIYGEIYGKGIQKNYEYGLNDIKFAGFDVEVDGVYQDHLNEKTHFNCLELPRVTELYVGNWSKEQQDKFVFDNFIYGTKVPHEGVVVKSITGERSKAAKVINPDYLIYGEKNNVGDSH